MLLIMKVAHPETGIHYNFVDKYLPFGSLISCAIFQAFSDAIAFVIQVKVNHPNINYLDDYLFAAALRRLCNWHVNIFMEICSSINFPVSTEKTEWAVEIIVFLGLLIDCVKKVVCIPIEKIHKALQLIDEMLSSKNNKATVLHIQKLAGFLNFLCKSIVPGRAFTTRLYALVSSKLKPHHHVKIPKDVRQDLNTWKQFLSEPQCFCCSFLD